MMDQINKLLIGRYRIIQELPGGGFGKTYIAEDIYSSNLLCAIKKLAPQSADIETAKILFQREASILNTLQQNHQIPKFFNYFEIDGNCYLVEEYIEGKTLNQLLDHKWSNQKVITFLKQILLILQSLHKQNIIHRDIKPSNLIIREADNKFVLIDFGAVKKIDRNYSSFHPQATQTMIGSYGYAPLEQMAGKPGFNSDIYALGMTAIQFLTGIYPNDLRRDVKDNVIWENAIAVDKSLAAILTKMVRSHPQERYQTIEEVLKDLDAIALATEISTKQQPSYQRTEVLEAQAKQSTQINETQNKQRIQKFKLWYIPVALTALGTVVVCLEFIHPFFRPIYYLYQGNRLLDTRQPQAALEEFRNLRSIQPDSAAAWKGQGDVLFSLGQYLRALDSYNQALKFQPNDIKILNNIGKVLYKQGKIESLDKALNAYEKVLQLDPNNAEALSGKGLVYLGKSEPEKATDSFNKLRQIKIDDPRIWQEIGYATEQSQGRQAAKSYFEAALSSYDDILKTKPNDLIALTDQGSVLLKLNRPLEALGSYDKALAIDKNFYEALIGKGNALSILGQQQYALSSFDRAREIRPKDFQVWYNRGTLLAQAFKKHEEALKSFNQAIKFKDDFYPAWLGKGLALSELKRYNEALSTFDKAKDLEPRDPFVWANRGDVLEQLGRPQEARESYNKAIELGFTPEQLKSLKSE